MLSRRNRQITSSLNRRKTKLKSTFHYTLIRSWKDIQTFWLKHSSTILAVCILASRERYDSSRNFHNEKYFFLMLTWFSTIYQKTLRIVPINIIYCFAWLELLTILHSLFYSFFILSKCLLLTLFAFIGLLNIPIILIQQIKLITILRIFKRLFLLVTFLEMNLFTL